jgi:hypothetical protein
VRDLSIALLDPPRYRVGHCTVWEVFDKPRVGVPRIWTITYTAHSLELYCEHEKVRLNIAHVSSCYIISIMGRLLFGQKKEFVSTMARGVI